MDFTAETAEQDHRILSLFKSQNTEFSPPFLARSSVQVTEDFFKNCKKVVVAFWTYNCTTMPSGTN
jgi:hypothetical protein